MTKNFTCFRLANTQATHTYVHLMATENLKQRIGDDQRDSDVASVDKDYDKAAKRDKKIKMAKRGVRSLSIAVALPLIFALLNIYFFGSSDRYVDVRKKSPWFPSLLVLHTAFVASAFLMGLSSWLVWAEGGFHNNPTALCLYLSQLGLILAWDPVVFPLGAYWVGFFLSLAIVGSLVGCYRVYKEVNPIAGDMVKPCLALAVLLALVNLKLVLS